MGNRIEKKVVYWIPINNRVTYYVHDAQGNCMAIYTRYQKDLTLEERNIYGSSRVGVEYPNDVLASVNLASNIHVEPFEKQRVGDKRYELSNHLGNVLEVITDRKLSQDNGTGGVDFYTSDVVSYSDYFCFGMPLPGRHGSVSDYRYGFQGQECDDEIKGEGNSINYTYRMHDPRIGRFFAVDPLTRFYPHYTPYSFSGNKVIAYIELEGLEEVKANGEFPKYGIKTGPNDPVEKDLSLASNKDIQATVIRYTGIVLQKGDVFIIEAYQQRTTKDVAAEEREKFETYTIEGVATFGNFKIYRNGSLIMDQDFRIEEWDNGNIEDGTNSDDGGEVWETEPYENVNSSDNGTDGLPTPLAGDEQNGGSPILENGSLLGSLEAGAPVYLPGHQTGGSSIVEFFKINDSTVQDAGIHPYFDTIPIVPAIDINEKGCPNTIININGDTTKTGVPNQK